MAWGEAKHWLQGKQNEGLYQAQRGGMVGRRRRHAGTSRFQVRHNLDPESSGGKAPAPLFLPPGTRFARAVAS